MQLDKLTLKSQEALQAAQQIAAEEKHQELTPAHLAKAILEQPDGVVVPALQKMGVTPSRVLAEVNSQIKSIPQVSGTGATQIYGSNDLRTLLDKSYSAATEMGDEYVSQEHIFLALLRASFPLSEKLRGPRHNREKFSQGPAHHPRQSTGNRSIS
ncbi:MAG: hypothetical protein JKP90_16640 [Desulfofustis sp. PB-SRB1]|nr:hypothetical protein [Desulfofustis sp. PB-SRB1]